MDQTFPLPPDIKPTALYVCFTANIFVLKSESSPQLTPPPPLPPSRLVCLDSWQPDLCSEIHESGHIHIYLRVSSVQPGGEGVKSKHGRNRGAERQPFYFSLSAHTPVQLGESEEGEGREREKDIRNEMIRFACVCF